MLAKSAGRTRRERRPPLHRTCPILPKFSPECDDPAGLQDEPNVAVYEEWMKYTWRLRGRRTALDEVYRSKTPGAWTLKQISHPKAAKVWEEREERILKQCRAGDRDIEKFDLAHSVKCRRDDLWRIIIERVFSIIPYYDYDYDHEGWKVISHYLQARKPRECFQIR